ncbi:MAG TPA: hypothetical protein PK854_02925 [Oscillospiraceae bacterium]|nr:hypothetical protein [Oscillospiraceae bacterium]
MMKKITAAFMALIFFSAGCSGKGGSANPPVSPTEQVGISVTNYYSFVSQNEYSYYYDKDTRDAWIEYMSVHSNTDFTIYNEQIGQSTELAANGEREGLVLLDNPLKIKELAHEGKILPLDGYLAKNTSWLALPEEFRNTFKIEGNIYAIPYSPDSVIGSGLSLNRELAVNTQWLKQLGLQMPKTLAEFENVGKQFLLNDMNGDGVVGNDFLLCFFNPAFNTQIMQAFGLYFDQTTSTTLGYDPELGCIADALFKGNAEQALTYLKQLFADGVIDPDSSAYYNFDQISEDAMAGKYGTIYMTNPKALLEAGLTYAAANYERITGKPFDPMNKEVLQWASEVFEPMPPLSTEHPLTYSNSVYGYVMTSATPMPNQVINRFVDLCYGLNGASYLECNFGDGAYTLQSDGTCTAPAYDPLYGIAIGNTELGACPNLGGYYQNSLGERFAVSAGKSGAEYAEVLTGLKKKIDGYIDRYQAQKLMVEVPAYYAPGGPAYEESAKLLRRNVYGQLYRAVIFEKATIAESLKSYREDAVFYGVADVLKESNAALGLQNAQILQ